MSPLSLALRAAWVRSRASNFPRNVRHVILYRAFCEEERAAISRLLAPCNKAFRSEGITTPVLAQPLRLLAGYHCVGTAKGAL